jgi:hypothetical protein
VKGAVPHLIKDGLSILQYGDDTIIFMDHDIEQAKKHETSFVPSNNYRVLKLTFTKANLQFRASERL